MSETTLLRQNAIRNNASVGATTPGPVKTGELPHVQIKAVPTAPQLQASQQQKTVQILAPNSKGAVTTGQIPMLQIKMGQNGPQPDNGQEGAVVVRDNKQPTLAGNLPMVQVKNEGGPPKVQTMPNVANAPPRIPTAAPALSAPRMVQPGVTRVAAPAPAPVVAAVPLPELPTFSTDELMLFQHALTIYVANLSAATEVPAEGADSGEPTPESEAVQFAKAVLAKTDDALVAIAIHQEAAANAAAAPAPVETLPVAPRVSGYVAPRAVTGGYYSPASVSPQGPQAYQVPQQGQQIYQAPQQMPQQALTPAPAVAAPRTGGYVMQQPSVRRTQLNSGLVPRGVPRAKGPDGKLPMAIIQMNGQKAVVQNQAEIDAARAALEAQAQAADAPAADDPSQG